VILLKQMVRRARPEVPLLVVANKSDRLTARKPKEVRRIVGVEEGVPVVPASRPTGGARWMSWRGRLAS
jgi:signal recognition particle receptor subunit beta